MMKRGAVIGLGVVFGLALWAAAAVPASAFTITFGGATGLRASITVETTANANQLKFVVQNTSTAGTSSASSTRKILYDPADCGGTPPNIGSTTASACRLLASFGWGNLAISQSITGGTAAVASGSTYFGDVAGTCTTGCGGFDWSPEWGFANNAAPNSIGTYDFVSTNVAQITPFVTGCSGPGPCPGNRDGPDGLDGPQGGILSTAWTTASGLGYVRDTLEFIITFSGDLSAGDLTALQSATWFVEFGSGTTGLENGNGTQRAAEPGSLLLLAGGLVVLLGARPRRREAPWTV